MPHTIFRNSKTGRFVTQQEAISNPDTTESSQLQEKSIVRMLNEYEAMVQAVRMAFPEWPDSLTMADAIEKGYVTYTAPAPGDEVSDE